MKKSVSVILIIFVIVSLSFLFVNRKTAYPLSQESTSIAKIELVTIKNYKYAYAQYYDDATVLATIAPADYDSFLSAFFELTCKKSMGISQECVEGLCIRFTYHDGAYELISSESGFYCPVNEDYYYLSYYFDDDMFRDFINSWLKL